MKQSKKQSIYLMTYDDMYKIGISNDPESRYKTFLTGNPKIKLVCYSVPVTFAHKLEKSLHHLLVKENVHGEWFSLNQCDVESLVKLLSNLRDDIETLNVVKQLF